jgi:hypothetical protein
MSDGEREGESMPAPSIPVEKEIPLKCLDCEHEFVGRAELIEHYIQDGAVLARTCFNHTLENCPRDGSPRVIAQDANLMC